MHPTSSLDAWLEETSTRLRREGRPIVTLSYAQSLDGSIALRRGAPLAISGAESMRMTHQLRAAQDAILAGIGTFESDNPQLTARLAEGESPIPVILDSHLRTSPGAKIFEHPKKPVLVCLETDSKSEKSITLARAGAVILPVKGDGQGHVSLPELLPALVQFGIRSLMVEGGATVIGEFLRQGLVDRVMLTIAPVFIGGLNALENPSNTMTDNKLRLKNTSMQSIGSDFVIFGEFDR
jgi:GTP cyclohydrolase II